MLAGEQAIVIAGTAENWSDSRTVTPLKPTREPNGTLWFGPELELEGDQVWFRIEEEAIPVVREVCKCATACPSEPGVPASSSRAVRRAADEPTDSRGFASPRAETRSTPVGVSTPATHAD